MALSSGEEAATPAVEEAAQGAPAEPVGQDVNASAESSAAGQGEKSFLDTVVEAMEPEKAPDSDDTDEEAGADPAAEAQAEAGDVDSDPTEEELSQYKPKTRKRIEALLETKRDLTTKLEQQTPQVEAFNQVVGFMREADLNAEEVNLLFEAGKALKQDPFKALEIIQPIFEQLQQITGGILPADLQEDVRQGVISEDRARELAALRGVTAVKDTALQRTTQQAEQQNAQQRHTALVGEVRTAISSWEQKASKADPDFAKKQGRIMKEIELSVLKNGFPKDSAAAVQVAVQAHRTVSDELRALAPKKPAVTPITGHPASAASRPEPKSTLDAINAAWGA
jgi:hypothetical protein